MGRMDTAGSGYVAAAAHVAGAECLAPFALTREGQETPLDPPDPASLTYRQQRQLGVLQNHTIRIPALRAVDRGLRGLSLTPCGVWLSVCAWSQRPREPGGWVIFLCRAVPLLPALARAGSHKCSSLPKACLDEDASTVATLLPPPRHGRGRGGHTG